MIANHEKTAAGPRRWADLHTPFWGAQFLLLALHLGSGGQLLATLGATGLAALMSHTGSRRRRSAHLVVMATGIAMGAGAVGFCIFAGSFAPATCLEGALLAGFAAGVPHLISMIRVRLRTPKPLQLACDDHVARLVLRETERRYRIAPTGEPGAKLDQDPLGRPVLQLSDGERWPLFSLGIDEPGMGQRTKRAFDLVIGTLLILPCLPLCFLAAALTVLTSGWPPLYRQVRLTRGGQTFVIHKIRTMIRDAEPGGQAVWPTAGDPRITPLGRWLRRFWIDELVQLFDVLRGPMSLIGPRPERPEFASGFTADMPNYHLRGHVKAGLTGLAQAQGYFGDTSIQHRLDSDLAYIRNWTPGLDFRILAATIWRLLGRVLGPRGDDVASGEGSSPPKARSTST